MDTGLNRFPAAGTPADFANGTEPTEAVRPRYAGPVFRIETHSIRLPDGRAAVRDLVLHGGGVAVVALTDAGEVILVRQYRKAAGQWVTEIPAGKREEGEEPLTTARRELHEETGYRARHWQPLGTLLPTPGYCSETIYLYCATGLEPGAPQPDDGEYLQVEMRPFAEALAQALDGELTDAKTVIGLARTARRMEQERKERQE